MCNWTSPGPRTLQASSQDPQAGSTCLWCLAAVSTIMGWLSHPLSRQTLMRTPVPHDSPQPPRACADCKALFRPALEYVEEESLELGNCLSPSPGSQPRSANRDFSLGLRQFLSGFGGSFSSLQGRCPPNGPSDTQAPCLAVGHHTMQSTMSFIISAFQMDVWAGPEQEVHEWEKRGKVANVACYCVHLLALVQFVK